MGTVIAFPNKYNYPDFDIYIKKLQSKVLQHSKLPTHTISQKQDIFKLGFIMDSFRILQTLDDEWFDQNITDAKSLLGVISTSYKGDTYDVEADIVKKMKHTNNQNVYEIKIQYIKDQSNFKISFRAYFFKYIYDDKCYYCMVKPHDKVKGNDIENKNIQFFLKEIDDLIDQIKKNPQQYAVHFK